MSTSQTDQQDFTAFRPVHSPDEWQQILRALPNPHALQSWYWGAFKSRWGWTSHPLAWQPAGQPRAAAMVLQRRLSPLPFSILYVPKGPTLEYADDDLRRQVITRLERLTSQKRAIFIKIDPDVALTRDLEPEQPDATGRAFRGLLQERGWRFSPSQVQFRNTVELDLTRPADEILAAMKQKTRYNIRLAGRRGVVVRPGDPSDFPLVYNIYAETAARDGFTIRPKGYYLDAWETLYDANMAHLLIAEYENEPLGAVIIVRYAKRAIYMYGASTDRERKRMPNYLLQWKAIRWAQQAGCQVYDFWGAPDEFVEGDPLWGVWRFKAGFHGRVVRHIGAWDYPARPFWYWLTTVIIPRYLDFLRSRPPVAS